MNCIILEDEALALSVVEGYIGRVDFLTLLGSFRSPLKALECVRTHKPELLFLDINMPDLSGMDFLENLNYQPYVIFTTAYSEYALKSFEYNTLDYLLKPIRFNRFLKAVTKANAILGAQNQRATQDLETLGETIFIKNSEGIHRVELQSLLFVESLKNYVTYNTLEGHITVKQSLSEVEQKLPKDQFIRIHRSFIVNSKVVKSLRYDGITLANAVTLPVGRSYRAMVKAFMSSD